MHAVHREEDKLRLNNHVFHFDRTLPMVVGGKFHRRTPIEYTIYAKDLTAHLEVVDQEGTLVQGVPQYNLLPTTFTFSGRSNVPGFVFILPEIIYKHRADWYDFAQNSRRHFTDVNGGQLPIPAIAYVDSHERPAQQGTLKPFKPVELMRAEICNLEEARNATIKMQKLPDEDVGIIMPGSPLINYARVVLGQFDAGQNEPIYLTSAQCNEIHEMITADYAQTVGFNGNLVLFFVPAAPHANYKNEVRLQQNFEIDFDSSGTGTHRFDTVPDPADGIDELAAKLRNALQIRSKQYPKRDVTGSLVPEDEEPAAAEDASAQPAPLDDFPEKPPSPEFEDVPLSRFAAEPTGMAGALSNALMARGASRSADEPAELTGMAGALSSALMGRGMSLSRKMAKTSTAGPVESPDVTYAGAEGPGAGEQELGARNRVVHKGRPALRKPAEISSSSDDEDDQGF